MSNTTLSAKDTYAKARRLAVCAVRQSGGKDVPVPLSPASELPVDIPDEDAEVFFVPRSMVEKPEKAARIFDLLCGRTGFPGASPEVDLGRFHLRFISEEEWLRCQHEFKIEFGLLEPYAAFDPIECRNDLEELVSSQKRKRTSTGIDCSEKDDERLERSRRRVALGMPPR